MSHMQSNNMVIEAPMSFAGSRKRIWQITDNSPNELVKYFVIIPLALTLIICVWSVVLCWYVLFGIFLIPYRLMRRSQRKSKRDELRHKELVELARNRNAK